MFGNDFNIETTNSSYKILNAQLQYTLILEIELSDCDKHGHFF